MKTGSKPIFAQIFVNSSTLAFSRSYSSSLEVSSLIWVALTIEVLNLQLLVIPAWAAFLLTGTTSTYFSNFLIWGFGILATSTNNVSFWIRKIL